MKKLIALILILSMAMCCVFADEETAVPEIPEERFGLQNPETLLEEFSYVMGHAYGLDYFQLYKTYYFPEMIDYFGALGEYDYSIGISLYDLDEMNEIFNTYVEDYYARVAEQAEKNLKIAEDFLAENAKKSGIKTTSSGLQYKVVKQGNGAKAKSTDSVVLDYQLTLLDGTIIDSSYSRGTSSTFSMTQVIPGFAEGVMLMPMGSKYVFYIHPSLGYGENGSGSIEPNSLLIFEVETHSIEK